MFHPFLTCAFQHLVRSLHLALDELRAIRTEGLVEQGDAHGRGLVRGLNGEDRQDERGDELHADDVPLMGEEKPVSPLYDGDKKERTIVYCLA